MHADNTCSILIHKSLKSTIMQVSDDFWESELKLSEVFEKKKFFENFSILMYIGHSIHFPIVPYQAI